jgi:Nickel responsive protein SCO4226-like
MKYFMDTHDKAKGTFPAEELTEEQFFAFCFMSGPDEGAIRKAHAAVDFPFDSITEVRRVSGADMRRRP